MTGVVHLVEQRSDEWRALRLGRLNGSQAASMLATIKSGEAASRRNLRTQLVLERVTGKPQESTFLSSAMQQGMDREPDALAAYESQAGAMISRVGYVASASCMAGFSPDGIVNDGEGIVECKAPLAATHLAYLQSSEPPSDYARQILHGLWISGAEWCDYVSYNADFPEALRLKVLRVRRDELAVRDYESAALKFLAEVDTELALMKELANAAV